MRQLSFALAATLATAAAAGCAEPAPLATATAELACYDWGCTGNSPVMGPYRSHEFHTGGLENREGLRVDGLWIAGVRYAPLVIGARLSAVRGATVKTGAALVDGYFRVLDDDTGAEFHIRIAHVSNVVRYWLGDADVVQTYELVYRQLPAITELPVCANPPDSLDPTSGGGAPAAWLAPFEAILFTGDRYDGVTKAVWATGGEPTHGWFNIGCAGSALAKLHLNRHTTAGAKGLYVASPDARQTLLNAFTANLCGTGAAFTEPGTPLRWTDAAGWKPALDPAATPEGVWGPAGVICLEDAYRLPWFDPAAVWCAPPPCDQVPGFTEATWKDVGLVRTAVP